MNIKNEQLSNLLEKYILVVLEIQRLNSLLLYYNDCGNTEKTSQIVDTMKRLELSKNSIAVELDERLENARNS